MNRNALLATVTVVALLVGVGGVLYAFGTPEQQQPVSPIGVTVATAVADEQAPPATGAVSQAEALAQNPPKTEAEAPAPDPSSPLAIEIPGCRCHSDDPKLVKQHAEYRMNQCAGCHAGGVPTGQEQ